MSDRLVYLIYLTATGMSFIYLTVATLLVLFFQECAIAQGIVGIESDIRDLNQAPPMLVGRSDDKRWSLFLTQQKDLIGMRKETVMRIFGKGCSYRTKNELHYQLTESRLPQKARLLI